MGKRNVTICVDGEIWDDLRKLFPSEMSGKINDFLFRLRAYTKGDLSALTITESRKKIAKLDEKTSKIEAERRILMENLDKMMQKQAQNEEKAAEKERLEAENQITCDVCGVPKPNEFIHLLPNGKVCNGCYLAEPPETLRKYFKNTEKSVKISENEVKNEEN